ncbi:MAG: hypothetical protein IPJ08_00535 [Burkholderiales bacterium]|nr:hypothetical protein [Burkholderiales bacterium]
MAHITFFEKPGCGGNARQRAALLAAGHTLDVRSLLSAPWTAESLLAYLAPLPVADWFNRAAPRVKSGEVQPEQLSPDHALMLLLGEPLLIRRPLMHNAADSSRHVGFDTAAVAAWIGLAPTTTARATTLEGCASPAEHCATPATPATPGAPDAHV